MSLIESRADSIFYLVLFFSMGAFALSELTWVIFKFGRPKKVRAPKQHLDWIWSFIPAMTLLVLTLVKSR